jgi:hypothetical protein
MAIAIKPERIREPTCACGQGVACDGGFATEAAASMTGAALPVDSGWTAHGPCSASMPRNALRLRREAGYEATMRALCSALAGQA